METIMLNEDSVSALSEVETNCSSATYATLTPLQPLSPLSLEKADSIYGGIYRGLLSESNKGNNFTRCNGFDFSPHLSDYELLEPLKPTVFIDKEGNAVDFNENQASPAWSFLSQATFLSARLPSYDWSKGELAISDDTTDDNQWGREGVELSRASSPDASQSLLSSSSWISYTPNPVLLSALNTVATTEELEEFMNSEVVETRDLSSLIGHEIRRYNIPQVLFAQKILGRSQGTLSDLLRNPRPWSKLKTGRDQFAKIWQWLREPESQRLLPFMNCGYKFDGEFSDTALTTNNGFGSPITEIYSQDSNDATPVKKKKLKASPAPTSTTGTLVEKRPRILFSDPQRQILQAAFERDPRPTREQQEALAAQLNVPYSSISNFFINSRRKLRKEESELVAASGAESVGQLVVENVAQINYVSEFIQ